MASPRVFVVTGANRGLGKSIVKLLLLDETEKIVYLTSRNAELGESALKEFEDNGMHPRFHQLDITDKNSIEALRDHLVKEHGGLDVLINNAGIGYGPDTTIPFSQQALETINCNFVGTLQSSDILFPILRGNARVVQVSSLSGDMDYKKLSDAWKLKFSSKELTMEELTGYISQFVSDAQEDKVEENGWPKSAYGISKIGVSLMAQIQQKEMDKTDRNIVVNSCCPGPLDTDFCKIKNPRAISPDEGADTPVYLALLPLGTTVKGGFVRKRTIHPYPPLPA